MKNVALALYIEFGTLHEQVQELPVHGRAPDSATRKSKKSWLVLLKNVSYLEWENKGGYELGSCFSNYIGDHFDWSCRRWRNNVGKPHRKSDWAI
jgi:hypothetical protein